MWSLGVFFGGFALGTLKIENVIRFAQCVLKVASNMIFGVVDRQNALRRGLATSVTQTRCLCGSNRCDTELRDILTLCGFYMFNFVTLSHFRHFTSNCVTSY